jgi:hypothetical protein
MTVGRELSWAVSSRRAGGAMVVMDIDRGAEAIEVYLLFYTI